LLVCFLSFVFLVPPFLSPVSSFSALSLLVYGLLLKRLVVSVCFVIDLVALAAAQQVVVGGRTDGRTEAQAVAAATGIFSNARLCFVLVLFSRLFPLLCRKLCCNPSPVVGVPLVCLSFSRMLFVFVSGKTFVPAFQRGGGGRAGGPESRLQGRVGVMYTLCTYSCVSVSDCVKFCVLRVSILGLFSAACSPISWATDLTSLWLASDAMACFFSLQELGRLVPEHQWGFLQIYH
jgi:hypothetical protein